MNPTYLSSLASVLQIVLPHFTKKIDGPQQCLTMISETGEISVATTSDGVDLILKGDAEREASAICAKFLNLEIEVHSDPDFGRPSDMVFVAKRTEPKDGATQLSFKCVYLPRSVPCLYATR